MSEFVKEYQCKQYEDYMRIWRILRWTVRVKNVRVN